MSLDSTRFLTETTANEVVVTGHAGTPSGAECVATDMAVVVFVDPPMEENSCDDGKPRLLVFEYTGRGVRRQRQRPGRAPTSAAATPTGRSRCGSC